MTRRAVRGLAPLLTLLLLLGRATLAQAQQTPPPPPPKPTAPAPTQPSAPEPRQPPTTRADGPAADTTRRQRPAAQPDSLYDALLELPGFTPVEYQADSASFNGSERTLRLRGDATVKRAGTQLEASDSIVYREPTKFVEAYGKPKVTGQGEDIAGNVMFYDLATKRATVRGAQTKVTQNATWLVRGDVTAEDKADRIYATESTFTSDDREQPAYYFKARQIKVVRGRWLVGRPAVLYFRNVPVLALPFIAQSMEKGRRSGLLKPQFALTDIIRTAQNRRERGTGREVSNLGYYWAVNPYMGLTVAAGWRSGLYRSLGSGLDFKWRRQFLDGGFAFERLWRSDGSGGKDFNLNGKGNWAPSERTKLSANANFVSNTSFQRRRLIDPTQVTQTLTSGASASHDFSWGRLDLSGNRSQSLADGRVETMLPNFNLTVPAITLFRSAGATDARWYNDLTLALGGISGRRNRVAIGDALARRTSPITTTTLGTGPQLNIGGFTVSSSVSFNQVRRDALAATDSFPAIRAATASTASWNASTSYQFRLNSATTLSPGISVGQELVNRADSLPPSFLYRDIAAGRWVAAPPRTSFNASLTTQLFGFFPGLGPYSAVRHHITPSLRYSYSPGTRTNVLQSAAFGPSASRTTNQLSLSLSQTFEGKLKEPRAARQRDTTALDSTATLADSTGARGAASTTPATPNKVLLLGIQTSTPLSFDFNPPPRDSLNPTRYLFTTRDLSNTITSDLLGGLNLTVGHDLFQETRGNDLRVTGRKFSPFLQSVTTSFNLGQNSALFRFLGLARKPNTDARGDQPALRTDSAGSTPLLADPRAASFTGNTQQAGGGPWSASFTYSLSRQRPRVDSLGPLPAPNNQTLGMNLSFYPSRNWGVRWNTSYNITDGSFSQHSLNLTRNLYRWKADFNFYRTAAGVNSFAFTVNLIDLPDLKFDYRQNNAGARAPAAPGTVP